MTVTINGTTGYTGPIGAIGDLSTTGNTTLGDASGDTLTINGSTTTFTQGTANGVAYLNGSKVLTTGSALTFDGTNLNTTGKLQSTVSSNVVQLYQTGSVGYIETGGSSATPIGFANGGTEKMRLDTSGNLGLGVTPSAWQAGSGIQFQDGVSFTRYGYTRNAYFDGSNYRYISTAAASLYLQSAGAHSWFNSASGTAGNTITFTQAMTLDASGRLGIGTTSPSTTRGPLTVLMPSNQNQAGIVIRGANSGGSGSQPGLTFEKADGTINWVVYADQGTNYFAINSGATERLRITSGGSLIVGTGASSTSYTMSVYPSSGDGTIEAKGPGAYLFLNSVNSGFSAVFGYDNGAGRWVVGQLGRGGSDGASIYYGSGNTEAARFASTIEMYRSVLLRQGLADTYSVSLSGNYTSGTWYSIANSGNLGSGIFVLQAYVDTYLANGSVYYMIYASVPFFMYDVGSNNTVTFDLPTMFGTGHANNGVAAPPIRFRMTPSGQGIFVEVQPNQSWTGLNGTGGKNVNFNFKRIG